MFIARPALTLALIALAGAAQGQTVRTTQLATDAPTTLQPAGVQRVATTLPETMANLLLTGSLVIATNNAQQQIEVEVGPVPGEVRVFGVSSIPDGMVFTDVTAISLTTGRAQDFVEFRFFSEVVPAVTLNTGLGNSDTIFRYFIPFTLNPVSSSVNVIGNSANDKTFFEVISEADSFAAAWNVAHGNGDNETTASINSASPSSALAVDLFGTSGTGQDVLNANVISGAAAVDIGFGGTMGSGNDSAIVVIDEQSPGASTLALNLDLGAGLDVAEALVITRGGTADLAGSIRGGDGSDTLKALLEGAGSTSLTLDGGAGSDNLDSEYKGAVTGAPSLLGGSGNDLLKIVADQPDLLSPFIDGGTGFDEAIGFGTIVNVEQIN
jgi:hypothetical protein